MCLAVVPFILGCPRRATVTSKNDRSAQTATADDLLKSAVHQLRPENFSIAAAPDKPVSLLNSWFALATASTSEASKVGAESPSVPTGWALPDEMNRIALNKFDEGDAVHIRDCLLTNSIAKHLAARSDSELGRVHSAFDFVVRNDSIICLDVGYNNFVS